MSLTSYTPRIKCIIMDRAFCYGQDSDFPNVYEVIGEPAIVLNGVPDAASGGSRTILLDTTSNQEVSGDPRFGEWMEGRKICKLFRDQYYEGRVESYDAETNWYRVVYDDGDFEDLYWHELEEVLIPLDISVPLTTLALEKFQLEKSAYRPVSNRVKARTKDINSSLSAPKTPELLHISNVAEARDGKLLEGNLSGMTCQSKLKSDNKGTSARECKGEEFNFKSVKSTTTADRWNGPKSESSDVYKVIGEPAILINGVPDVTPEGRTYTCLKIDDVKMDDDPCFGDWLEGREIKKFFGDRYYSGKVEKYDDETKWYRVVYEDGDFEDLYWHELEELLVPLDISIPLTTLALRRFKSEKESRSKKAKKRKNRTVCLESSEKTLELIPESHVGELIDVKVEPCYQLFKHGKDAIASNDDQNGETKMLQGLPSSEIIDMNGGEILTDVHRQAPIQGRSKGQGVSRKQSLKTARAEKLRRVEKVVVRNY